MFYFIFANNNSYQSFETFPWARPKEAPLLRCTTPYTDVVWENMMRLEAAECVNEVESLYEVYRSSNFKTVKDHPLLNMVNALPDDMSLICQNDHAVVNHRTLDFIMLMKFNAETNTLAYTLRSTQTTPDWEYNLSAKLAPFDPPFSEEALESVIGVPLGHGGYIQLGYELRPFIIKATQHFLTRHPSPFYKPPHVLCTGFSLAAAMGPHIAKIIGETFPHLPASMHTFNAPPSMNLFADQCMRRYFGSKNMVTYIPMIPFFNIQDPVTTVHRWMPQSLLCWTPQYHPAGVIYRYPQSFNPWHLHSWKHIYATVTNPDFLKKATRTVV